MEIKVLVAYASTHGSTQEVAEAIVATLRKNELAVDLQPARSVRTLEGYGAVVLGAPLYMFHMHRDALRFLAKHKKALTGGIPIAIFAGGSIESGEDVERQEVRKQLDQELAKFPWLRPLAVEVIGGKFDPTRLHLPWSLIPALRGMPPRDLRDWDAIRTWAGGLAVQLKPVLSR
jgi:menaquinone-dependent protoporphyrinogen oxidase